MKQATLSRFEHCVSRVAASFESNLLRMLEVKSVSGREEPLIRLLADFFGPVSDTVELIPLDDRIRANRWYSSVIPEIEYSGRHNLVVTLRGECQERIILNAHADTVPLPAELAMPRISKGVAYGRGACDDKGQIAACLLLMMVYQELGIRPHFTVELHIVVEEEIGGNGTLSLMDLPLDFVRSVIVMEPTDLQILTGARGVLWFRISVKGVSGHSGDTLSTRSALLDGVRVIHALEKFHAELLESQRGNHPFEGFQNPMPLNFGALHSGDWPATVPDKAVVEGILGFLPGRQSSDIIAALDQDVFRRLSPDAGIFEVTYPFRRDPYFTNRDDPECTRFARAATESGIAPIYSALPACCDGWFYRELKQLPVIVFGAGSIAFAHSNNEQVELNAVRSAAHVLFNFTVRDAVSTELRSSGA
jgi:acetylornithine deacetylase